MIATLNANVSVLKFLNEHKILADIFDEIFKKFTSLFKCLIHCSIKIISSRS